MKDGRRLKIAGIVLLALVVSVGVIVFLADFIYYYGLNKKVYVELGDDLPIAETFLKDDGEIEYISGFSDIDKTKVGRYQVKINYNGKERTVQIIIEDTTAPVVQAKDVEVSVYDDLEAKDLLAKVTDKSKVKIEYKKKPDYGTVGSYEAIVKVEDEAGNVTLVSSKVDVCRVKDYVEYKFGDAFPGAESFIFSDKDTGELITDLGETVKKPGTYYVTVEIDGKYYKSKLIAVDRDAPVVVGKDAEISRAEIKGNASLMPSDFVYSYKDADDVTMFFVDTPDYASGDVIDVKIAVADISGNTTIINRKLYVVEHKGMDVELGSVAISDNILTAGLDGAKAALVSGSVDTNSLGRYPIVVDVDGVQKSVCINVVDPDAPSANAVAVSLEEKKDIVPGMFVSDVKDSSKVTITFENEPDKVNRGLQIIRLKLTDEAGNFSYVDTTLNILYDAISPELAGVTDITTFIRQKPDYLLGVSGTDDVDGVLTVKVDDSKVNYEVPGVYDVTYSATDKSGNGVVRVTRVEVKNVTREYVDTMVDDILKDIVDDSMSITQKARAAYDYIQENVRYINQADQSSVEKAAYDGLTLGVGDCFTFASLLEVFMERLGAETDFVSRDSDTSNHYWILCNLGKGWYHMDATPRNSTYKCFMKTDAENVAEAAYYWVYDKSLYPAVATESYKE